MKRKILLIGNDSGLPGVKVDIETYKSFFKSPFGGSWEDDEIDICLNKSKTLLQVKLAVLQIQQLDYLIIVFSGHGGQLRETVFEINDKEETISESSLQNLATRQLNIYDCCRCYPQIVTESVKLSSMYKAVTASNTKDKYNKRILQAIPQQVKLYSCSIGEVSHDTKNGGVYSQNLIKAAKNISSEYKLVSISHEEAANETRKLNNTRGVNEKQNPEAIIPRCLSSQQLILSINPNY